MTIKRTADQSGVGIETVRFYEREGLIPKPPRTSSGYRQYTSDTVSRLKFIKRAQGLGFTLFEIKELLGLKVSRSAKREDIRRKTRKKIEDIERKIKTLQQIKQTLEEMTDACRGNGPLSECPILKAFENEGCCQKGSSEEKNK